MQFSFIISTRNRAHYLQKTLHEFTKIEYPKDWEIIVINNASNDQTQEILTRLAPTLNLNITLLYEKNIGKSRALNKGIRKCKGKIVVFTDDDCYPDPDYLIQLEKVFNGEKEIGFVGGKILLYDSDDFPMTIQKSNIRKELPVKSFIPTGTIQGANFAFKKQVLQDIDGFDTLLGPGTPLICEDIDIASRATFAGWTGVYDPRPVIYHHHRVKSDNKASEKQKGYDIGRGAYYIKIILTTPLKKQILKRWAAKIINHPFKKTVFELYGALYYSFSLIKNVGYLGKSI